MIKIKIDFKYWILKWFKSGFGYGFQNNIKNRNCILSFSGNQKWNLISLRLLWYRFDLKLFSQRQRDFKIDFKYI